MNLKIPKKLDGLKGVEITKILPHILVVAFILISLFIVGFGYFIFKRNPSDEIVQKVQQDIDDISVHFDKEKAGKIFDFDYSLPEVNSNFKSKNPFQGF